MSDLLVIIRTCILVVGKEVVEVFDALEADFELALDLTFDVLTTPERLVLLQRCEKMRRWLPAVEHLLINQLRRPGRPHRIGRQTRPGAGNRLRISRAEASRRMHEAEDLGQRRALNGEPLPPVLEATAEAQRNGDLGAGHVAVIRGFWHRLPDSSTSRPAPGRSTVGRLAGEHRPDELAKLADKLTDCLDPTVISATWIGPAPRPDHRQSGVDGMSPTAAS